MRRFTLAVIIGVLVVGLLGAAGCGKEEEAEISDLSAVSGTYVSEEDSSDYIGIMPNHTFTMAIGSEVVSGSCDVQGSDLLLSAGSFSETMSIAGGVITTRDGTRFIISIEGREEEPEPGSHDTREEAIREYCREHGISIPSLTISAEKTVSVQDPAWEILYAFPAEAEGEGRSFLLRRVAGDWVVVAHTRVDQIGWTAAELEAAGAPVDLEVR